MKLGTEHKHQDCSTGSWETAIGFDDVILRRSVCNMRATATATVLPDWLDGTYTGIAARIVCKYERGKCICKKTDRRVQIFLASVIKLRE